MVEPNGIVRRPAGGESHVTPEQAWEAEVEAALAGRLPWRVDSVWCSQKSSMRTAGVTHIGTGERRTVVVAADVFVTPAERTAEVLRQLQDLE